MVLVGNVASIGLHKQAVNLHNKRVSRAKLKCYCITDMTNGHIGDMAVLGITESLCVKRQMLTSAAEAAEMILRVDNIIRASPRRRARDDHPC
jgi:chaperonin GroEL (HSP60 family)